MKIANETKIGILAAAALAILILGFNYLKGKNLLDPSKKIYAVFSKVDGINTSNPVMINGLQVGTIYKLQEKDKNLSGIIVVINLSKDVNIPNNSVAAISQSLLGTPSINIAMGDSKLYLQDGDTLLSKDIPGLVDQLQATLSPTLESVNGTLKSLDSAIEVIGGYFDPKTKNNFQAIIGNLSVASASLDRLLNDQSGALAKSMNNLNSFTGNLANNNDKITGSLSNLETATNKFANLKLDETLASLQGTLDQLNTVVKKANSNDGSLGLLMNDPKLYKNLENTSRSLNILLDDLRVHPKRYVSISVFGKKDKGTPLSAPLADSIKATN